MLESDTTPTVSHSKNNADEQQSVTLSSDKRLLDIQHDYINFISNGLSQRRPSTIEKYDKVISMMVHMVGNLKTSDFTFSLFTEKYAHRIHKLPARMNIKDRYKLPNGNYKHIDSILKIADSTSDHRLSNTTIESYILIIKSFINWGVNAISLTRMLSLHLMTLRKLIR